MHDWFVDIIGRAVAGVCCITEKHMQDGRCGCRPAQACLLERLRGIRYTGAGWR